MIKRLSKETIDKIAAGEVVERPLSVVKELVENSMDAGASAITVETKDGGSSLIRVTDNGCGIDAEDTALAFERHATSKIDSSEDLFRLHTLGFRGEALSSISAVSKLELITKTEDSIVGRRILNEGGESISEEEIAAPNGSTFFVRELFYNTPARRKFLKSNASENASIEEMLERLALSRPDISFKLTCEGKDRLYTSGTGTLKNTIFEIFGLNTANSVIEIDENLGFFKIKGYIGKSTLSHGNRSREIFFVNGRSIKSTTLEQGLENGYAGYLMGRAFPFCVLDIIFPDGSFDVNVHPSKMEVRFNDPDMIKLSLTELVHNKLVTREDIVEVSLDENAKYNIKEPIVSKTAEPFESNRLKSIKDNLIKAIEKDSPYHKQYERQEPLLNPLNPSNIINSAPPVSEDSVDAIVSSTMDSIKDSVNESIENELVESIEDSLADSIVSSIADSLNDTDKGDELTPEGVQESFDFLSKEARSRHRIIGQVFKTYWLIEYENKFYIIDQHAAHEKVLYERVRKSVSQKKMTSQMILPPIIISLSPTEEITLKRHLNSFSEAGYCIEHFGGRDYKITGIPAGLPKTDPKMLLLETLEDGLSVDASRIVDRVEMIACKAAVKGNNHMTYEEMDALLDELLTCENPYHCPHGRPTMISFTKDELDKKFGRIV